MEKNLSGFYLNTTNKDTHIMESECNCLKKLKETVISSLPSVLGAVYQHGQESLRAFRRLSGKESACSSGRQRFDPWVESP